VVCYNLVRYAQIFHNCSIGISSFASVCLSAWALLLLRRLYLLYWCLAVVLIQYSGLPVAAYLFVGRSHCSLVEVAILLSVFGCVIGQPFVNIDPFGKFDSSKRGTKKYPLLLLGGCLINICLRLFGGLLHVPAVVPNSRRVLLHNQRLLKAGQIL